MKYFRSFFSMMEREIRAGGDKKAVLAKAQAELPEDDLVSQLMEEAKE